MGATTTQGTGPGSASGKPRAEPVASLGVSRLIGPKVVAAGVKRLRSGTGVVTMPAPLGHPSEYCVILTSSSPTHAYISGDLQGCGDGKWSFEISGGEADAVHYAVIKSG